MDVEKLAADLSTILKSHIDKTIPQVASHITQEGLAKLLSDNQKELLAHISKSTFTVEEVMAAFAKVLREENGEFCVYSHDGKNKLGCHKTKQEALRQLAAVEMNKEGGTYVKPEGDKFCAYKDGEKIGTFDTKAEAEAALKGGKKDEKPESENPFAKSKFVLGETKDGMTGWNIDFPILKYNEDEQIVAGVVYEPDTEDAQGDFANAGEIRKAAYRYMAESGRFKVMHKSGTDGVRLLENYIAPVTFKMGNQMIRKGSWVMVLKVLDADLWKQVKDGKITGFSMGGRARTRDQK